MLKFEISSTSLYLIDPKDGLLKEPTKSYLSKELLGMVSVVEESPLSDCILFDFMAYGRKVPVKKINETGGSLNSFADLFNFLLSTFHKL